jgi:hypothetical protein
VSQRTVQVKTNTVLELNEALRELQQRLAATEGDVTALKSVPAPKIPTAAEMAAALAASGASPLNVANLPGQLAQVQKAAIPVVTALPNVSQAQNDQVCFYSGHLYHFKAGNPGAWTLIL